MEWEGQDIPDFEGKHPSGDPDGCFPFFKPKTLRQVGVESIFRHPSATVTPLNSESLSQSPRKRQRIGIQTLAEPRFLQHTVTRNGLKIGLCYLAGEGSSIMKDKKMIPANNPVTAPNRIQNPEATADPDKAALVLLYIVGKLFNRALRQTAIAVIEKQNKLDSDYVN